MKIVNFFKRIPSFLKEVKEELKKVSWSSRQELLNATVIVLIGSFFLTLFIALSDLLLARFLQFIIK
ncbi:MAG TPA: preprotein translocase subunit SecE [Candidatus Omnitrophica bacterium]|nr:MAG: preprotein translocase subunit SecE [Candidatus Omnitrophota bacterium]RKY43763.1 MAG: preprotein translocase subunit SecE [Candidatus Omnitrophota bacterium]HEC69108.1 preprotein translocase subunit SecE [Candidatus Omnitrophota bacterium]